MRKRAYLVIQGPKLPRGVERLELAPGFFAARTWPDGKPPLIPGVLEIQGERNLEPYESPSLVVWTERDVPDGTIGRVDDELTAALTHCDVSLAVVTRRVPRSQQLILTELWTGTERQFQKLKPLPVWSTHESWKQDWLAIEKWPAICARTLELLSPAGMQYEYFVRGLRSFFRACHQDWVEDRFELFCRSIETILQTSLGAGACQFAEGVLAHQGRLDREKKRHRILAWEKHYHRRNEIVHGHRFFKEERDHRAALLMERAARRYFEDLLTDQSFFDETLALQRLRVAERQKKKDSRQLRRPPRPPQAGPLPPTPRANKPKT